MKANSLPSGLVIGLIGLLFLASPDPGRLGAQPFAPNPGPPSPAAQRQVLEQLQHQLRWLDNATRNANMFNTGADFNLWQQYDAVRVGYDTLKQVLLPWQIERGANELAELDAGLAIIGEAFPNFQEDLNAGRNPRVAFRTLCQVLRDSFRLWGRELNQLTSRAQVGR